MVSLTEYTYEKQLNINLRFRLCPSKGKKDIANCVLVANSFVKVTEKVVKCRCVDPKLRSIDDTRQLLIGNNIYNMTINSHTLRYKLSVIIWRVKMYTRWNKLSNWIHYLFLYETKHLLWVQPDPVFPFSQMHLPAPTLSNMQRPSGPQLLSLHLPMW